MSTTDDETPAQEEASKPTLAEQRAAREAERQAKKSNGNGGLPRAAKRYGPFVAIALLVVGAVAIFSSRDSGGDDDDTAAGGAKLTTDERELTLSGPMTPEKAELQGKDVDFGDKCDTTTGRIKVPSIYAPPCVEPFTGDNGGATYQGVTDKEILVVRYDVDPSIDPVGSALARMSGIETNPKTAFQTASDYVDTYNKTFELYGRKVKIVDFAGTGRSDDAERAKADALAISEMKPFAVINSPLQSNPVFAEEMAHHKIMCISPCGVALPKKTLDRVAPYAWSVGPTPDQAAAMTAELVGNLAGPGKAELAGDSLKSKDRKYALVHYNTAAGDHTGVAEALSAALKDNGVDVSDDIEYLLKPETIAEDARTIVARLKSKGITSVIFYGDPLMPASLTKEATAQSYEPEWFLGPNLLADTATFGRTFDQEQWTHGFGIGLNPIQGRDEVGEAWRIYHWATGKDQPPNDNYAAIHPGIRNMFIGIQLAGPDLNPETFRDGMFRYPTSGGHPVRAQLSYGDHGVWDDPVDWGGSDDASVIWWDPDAEGTNEAGEFGKGMYRFANGAERYTIGHFPKTADDAGLFDKDSSMTIYDQDPPGSEHDDYPPPR